MYSLFNGASHSFTGSYEAAKILHSRYLTVWYAASKFAKPTWRNVGKGQLVRQAFNVTMQLGGRQNVVPNEVLLEAIWCTTTCRVT